MAAKYIIIEGCDGSGKSTQSRILKKHLEDKGYRVLRIREPSNTAIGRMISDKLIKKGYSKETVALTFAADRQVLKDEVLSKALEEYDFIISDRSFVSSLVYQPLMGLDIEWIKEINKYVVQPDLAMILDIDMDTYAKRRGETEVIFEKQEYQEKVRKGYLDVSDHLDCKVLIVDSTQEKNKVSEDLETIIKKEFGT